MGNTLLSDVESRLREVLDGHAGATHLIDAGGKRLRPMLVILGAEFGPRQDKVVDAAVLTELVHVGTLHHDDVMDQAPVRHGVPTANALWGNNRAILLGDLMLARAGELGAELGLPALRLQTTTLARLVRGQLMETVRPKSADPMAFCLEVMADKSASLIAMAAELGALVAEAPPSVCGALHIYGEHLGIAFQLVDDVLDIVGGESGKTPGTDLRAGVVTVPVLHALAAGDAAADRLRVLLVTGTVTDPDLHAEALGLLRDGPGPSLTRADAGDHAELARAALADLPRGEAREVLDSLCDAVLERAK
ncbi:polyprenyl synthetase family protein [Actinophytocola algeriensis]|uniref:Heptaprenyl diphosphate synthase n=1 Tax=Actinophytocola algeriensis TaxID=1768010 RepID=A0A7W7Q500_9PSEU|nr:polyprenyl synthetase family protein [Actinophytocola algeriensis]MBB4906948.1 heptaprenyl diphosphate synthase [Actinophytocola algeriensis]MBE1478430.1 heptaprenyl diphosphate synthase [Actinophytocola algeriensis]